MSDAPDHTDADSGEPRAPGHALSALARRRTELGMSLEDVAQQLKFAPRQIAALEAGDFSQVPAGAFARGMLRSYARCLKLDPVPLLAALGDGPGVAPRHEEAVVLRAPMPFADGARSVNLAYILVSVGLMVAVAALVLEWMRDGGSAAKLAFVPAAQTAPAPEPASAPQTMVSSIAATQVLDAPETAQPRPQAEPQRAGAQRRISLRFARESWVEITDHAGRTLISQLNRAGTEQALEGLPPFTVVVGNAQHVRFLYDDQPVDLMPHVKVEVARFTLE